VQKESEKTAKKMAGQKSHLKTNPKPDMQNKKLAQIVQDGLPILADIIEIKTTWSADDASSLLDEGAVLLCVAKFEGEQGHVPFRYALGWPQTKGVPSRFWDNYDRSAGED
jgi:hypothetical protein